MKQITAKQCAKIHPFLPVQRGNVRISNITFINAVLYVLKNGCMWSALPERVGNCRGLRPSLRRWSHSGALERLFAALQKQDADCLGLDGACVKVNTFCISAVLFCSRRRPSRGPAAGR